MPFSFNTWALLLWIDQSDCFLAPPREFHPCMQFLFSKIWCRHSICRHKQRKIDLIQQLVWWIHIIKKNVEWNIMLHLEKFYLLDLHFKFFYERIYHIICLINNFFKKYSWMGYFENKITLACFNLFLKYGSIF